MKYVVAVNGVNERGYSECVKFCFDEPTHAIDFALVAMQNSIDENATVSISISKDENQKDEGKEEA